MRSFSYFVKPIKGILKSDANLIVNECGHLLSQPELKFVFGESYNIDYKVTHISHDLTNIYKLIKKNKCTNVSPLATLICSPNNIDSKNLKKKYQIYKSIVIYISLNLNIKNEYKSSIRSAAQAIRRIGERYIELLDLLPEPNQPLDIINFEVDIVAKRKEKHFKYFEALRALFNYFLTNRNEIKRRADNIQIDNYFFENETGDVVDELIDETKSNDAIKIEKIFDSPKAKKHLIRKSKKKEFSIDSAKINARKIFYSIRINNFHAPCSADSLSESIIINLIEFLNNYKKDQGATLIFLVVILGRNVNDIFSLLKSEELYIKNNSISLVLKTSLPKPKLNIHSGFFVKNVQHKAYLNIFNLPFNLFEIINDNHSIDKANDIINKFNRKFNCAVTLSKLSKYLANWTHLHNFNPSIVNTIIGISPKKDAGLYYHTFEKKNIERYLNYYCEHFGIGDCLIEEPDELIGSNLAIKKDYVSELFNYTHDGYECIKKYRVEELHNAMVTHVLLMLNLTTGHRPINSPFQKITDINFINHTIWVSDKENRTSLTARILPIPPTTLFQLKEYIKHLQWLEHYTYDTQPIISSASHMALNASKPFLFYVIDGRPVKLTQKNIHSQLHSTCSLQPNFMRHFMRDELSKYNLNPEIINAFMGHGDFGDEGLNINSGLSLNSFKLLSDAIETIINNCNIKVAISRFCDDVDLPSLEHAEKYIENYFISDSDRKIRSNKLQDKHNSVANKTHVFIKSIMTVLE